MLKRTEIKDLPDDEPTAHDDLREEELMFVAGGIKDRTCNVTSDGDDPDQKQPDC
jgi:hypothetical protein